MSVEIKQVTIPDLGMTSGAHIIEVNVAPGDHVEKDQTLLTLEGEKATMEVPSPYAGVIKTIQVKVGDTVVTGTAILTMEISESRATQETKKSVTPPVAQASPATPPPEKIISPAASQAQPVSLADVHAGPSVRRLAYELGVELTRVKPTGPKNRILKDDVHRYVKDILLNTKQGTAATGSGLPQAPSVDFSQFGEIEVKPLSRIKKLTGKNMSRNWLLIPHVTQFHEADITAMEAFRKTEQQEAAKQGVKLTVLAFVMKAVAATLKAFPNFNASLDPNGENLILKKYFHMGVAVDTPEGLVVPVLRDVDKKGLLELAKELGDISQKARTKGLTPAEMQGSGFTISSLGGIGGTAFTPIINLPDVAILGVSKGIMKPVYVEGEFVPRLMLPLSLSYDHRVIDGAEGARFIMHLTGVLEDLSRLLL